MFGLMWLIQIQYMVAAFHTGTSITLRAFTLFTHTQCNETEVFIPWKFVFGVVTKNETNKNNPQLLGHVIFIYVAGSIQVPFEWHKLTNNRNIYRAIGGAQNLIWLKLNPKCCCRYKNILWSTWNCEHSHYYSAPFFTSLVISTFSTVHPSINCKMLLNIAVTPR